MYKNETGIKLINFSRNFGKEAAMSAAIDLVNADAIVPIDVDLQDPPELVLEFIRIWKEEGIDATSLKCPHMGWSDLTYTNGGSSLFQGIPEHSDFYFVHSYVICPQEKSVIKATADFGIKVPACVEKDNITVFQFHPEKSGDAGLRLLKAFGEL